MQGRKQEFYQRLRNCKGLIRFNSPKRLFRFLSTKSLEIIGSSRYKADIDAALDQAKILIVVGTNVEYMSSQWVRYEWDSFYNDFFGNKKGCGAVSLTQNISTNDLPRTLRNVQNFDTPKICLKFSTTFPT